MSIVVPEKRTTTNPQDDVEALRRGINEYIQYYNNERPHQGINNCKPREWYEYAA
ncbi:MAG: integrase core domain-containing protein [Bacteroidales bacterium]|nr:integrase core domain-containing protein [Bacteroidales bacterium]